MTTDSDEELRRIRAAAKQLKQDLLTWINSDTWGRDHYKEEFVEKCEEALTMLRQVMKLIGSK